MQVVFKFLNSLRHLMQAVCVLFVTALGLPPAPYMGFGVRLAGRCPASAAVFQFGFCSGLDKHLSTFFCYLQLSNFFGQRFRSWTLKMSSPTPSPIVVCHPKEAYCTYTITHDFADATPRYF
jgi:hypothetical protein